MKKILLFVLMLAAGSFLLAIAGWQMPPAAVKAAFVKKYPNATKVKWEKEDGNYEASFTDKGSSWSVIYNGNGVLQESEQEITPAELPAAVSTYMKEHYKNRAVKGAARITKADGSICYEAAVKGLDVIFDANGKFLKEVKD
ncbi:PepSY-like domain-containing protein [Sediminibacterium ginsengisoli]|uniref:Putative beta-lactamase-inhibitor-like, PepSY-like n=1 Tax=Sediminibacterium ginsengisoli TaxID=413434 RepID=A0A1T4R1T3_9BACT|nr:PepSY-like domain-containing protein [Sediminibacterium ginsengisoli]SKA10012.1 Putative beta-lactamase-inhibitor-like, PepSY-like [Sediminibacterium ginsengisoli]